MSRAIVRLAAGSVDLTNLGVALPSARSVRYVFCDLSVGRDGHTIANDAWRLGNFKRNPVFLWAHQSEQPPIGRVAGGKQCTLQHASLLAHSRLPFDNKGQHRGGTLNTQFGGSM
jgi:hypothetical protein